MSVCLCVYSRLLTVNLTIVLSYPRDICFAYPSVQYTPSTQIFKADPVYFSILDICILGGLVNIEQCHYLYRILFKYLCKIKCRFNSVKRDSKLLSVDICYWNIKQWCKLLYYTSSLPTVQYSTVQCSTVQYNTVQYRTVQYSTVQYSTPTVHLYSTSTVAWIENDS